MPQLTFSHPLLHQLSLKHVNVYETMWVAVLYGLCARVGQMYALEPGNITPVWIPSGVMVALALHVGLRIWPGVFLGAFAGNAWAYFSTESVLAGAKAISAGVLNGIGDTISTVLMAGIIMHVSKTNYPFNNIHHFYRYFLFAVLIGPLVSAFFGVGGLALFGFLNTDNVFFVFSTWFIGDGVGALLFGPLLLSWLRGNEEKIKYYKTIFTLLSLATLTITSVVFGVIPYSTETYSLCMALLPVVFFLILHLGQRVVFTQQVIVSAVAVYATSIQLGPFSQEGIHHALLHLQIFIAIFSLVIYVIALITAERKELVAKLHEQKDELEKLYRQDALTGLWNRYRIQEFVEFNFNKFQRDGTNFGVILIDVDNFKAVNDEFGHKMGDRILVEMAELLKSHIRSSDLLGRWGGEEFIIVVADHTLNEIKTLAEKLRIIVENHDFFSEKSVTISLGVSLVHDSDTESTLFERADKVLYRSKREGKNKVSIESSWDSKNMWESQLSNNVN